MTALTINIHKKLTKLTDETVAAFVQTIDFTPLIKKLEMGEGAKIHDRANLFAIESAIRLELARQYSRVQYENVIQSDNTPR